MKVLAVLSKYVPGVQATTGGSVDNLKLIGSQQLEQVRKHPCARLLAR
jgi:TRAP-type uncharacterized transport system substrate-binding protein